MPHNDTGTTSLEDQLNATKADALGDAVAKTDKFTRGDFEAGKLAGKAKTNKTTNLIAQVLLWVCCIGGVVLIAAIVALAVKYLIYVYCDEQRTADFVTAVVWTVLVALSTLFFEHKIVDKD